MKSRILPVLLVLSCVLFSVISFSVFEARRILGPRDNPNLEKMQWTSLRFLYSVIEEAGGPRIPRVMELTDEKEIDAIKGMMSTKSISPNSLGVRDESRIVMSDGDVWNACFVFENRLDVCKKAERYYSYTYELNDNRMYEQIRLHCLENERKTYPNADIKNIILRANLTDEAYEILGKGLTRMAQKVEQRVDE